MIFCLWFGLRPSCQVHITDNVGNNSISIMLNTVTSTRATQTVVTFYCLPPCTQKLLRHLKGLPNWIMIMQHENPSLIPFYHRYLICTVTVWRSAHLTFELGNLHRGLILVKVTRGWEARHRLVSQVGASSRLTSTPTPARPLLCAPPQQCWQATQSRNRKAIWCLFGTVHRQDEMYMCVSAVMSAWMFVSVCVWCVCHQCV